MSPQFRTPIISNQAFLAALIVRNLILDQPPLIAYQSRHERAGYAILELSGSGRDESLRISQALQVLGPGLGPMRMREGALPVERMVSLLQYVGRANDHCMVPMMSG
jgi:hypothetical protein